MKERMRIGIGSGSMMKSSVSIRIRSILWEFRRLISRKNMRTISTHSLPNSRKELPTTMNRPLAIWRNNIQLLSMTWGLILRGHAKMPKRPRNKRFPE